MSALRRDSLLTLRRNVRIFAAALAAAATVSACSTDECLDNKNSLPLAGFYASTPAPLPLRVDSLTVFGAGAPGDTVLLDCGNASQLYLPFRIDEPETTFVFRYDNKAAAQLGLKDVITFRYDIEPRFVSSACGAVYLYKLREIETTNVLIDSVSCPAGIIDNTATENIHIYFRYNDPDI